MLLHNYPGRFSIKALFVVETNSSYCSCDIDFLLPLHMSFAMPNLETRNVSAGTDIVNNNSVLLNVF